MFTKRGIINIHICTHTHYFLDLHIYPHESTPKYLHENRFLKTQTPARACPFAYAWHYSFICMTTLIHTWKWLMRECVMSIIGESFIYLLPLTLPPPIPFWFHFFKMFPTATPVIYYYMHIYVQPPPIDSPSLAICPFFETGSWKRSLHNRSQNWSVSEIDKRCCIYVLVFIFIIFLFFWRYVDKTVTPAVSKTETESVFKVNGAPVERYLRVCKCMYACVCVHISMYMYIRKHICIHVCISIHVCRYIYI